MPEWWENKSVSTIEDIRRRAAKSLKEKIEKWLDHNA